ncbi:cbb3-type cytochrome c oxidase subunit I [Flavobacterium sp. ENC]|uniref:cbb3-type cytochrome c oxidase subunit I n=1 Tax=Flavobacterium sp. ENC TaxID=2897330 RepID=UPI001E64AE16|nr:cbb3-type cytochrome c oxidase subunit I [Flavobacterium sp. ENC]MCD0466571.1 cbb3-type cytochrome c oxidase subunit I [Flavobacterium sp. ENC]
MMKYLLRKPYCLFFFLIAFFLIGGFLNAQKTLDINIHDTYFVISYWHFGVLLSFIYSFIALIYFVLIKLNFILIKWITVTHVIVSIGGVFLILLFFQLTRQTAPGDFESLLDDIDFKTNMTWGIWLTFLSILVMQALFIINVIQALFKGKR